jgi:hypothetical protein
MSDNRAPRLAWVIGAVAVVFGAMNLVAGGPVVFDLGTARADHGNYVPFVLYFHFLSGFVAIPAGVGVALGRRWGAVLAVAITLGIAITGAALGIHIATGGAYELETPIATAVRLVVWLGISAFAWTRRS